MGEILNTIILIIVIVVLILGYVLISYFYNTYNQNKDLVNYNFKKTADYVNTNTTTITNNISSLENKTNSFDSRITLINTTTTSNVNLLTSNFDYLKTLTQPLITNPNSNIANFDTSLKNYFNFKHNNSTINEKLYSYQFGVTPNLSLELLRNIDATSGMTIRTNNERLFRVCDVANANSCIDLNVNNGNFNVYPSATSGNTINNMNIMNSSTGSVLANFNFPNKSIYLGGANENAGLYIKEGDVYVKNLNLLKSGTNYSDAKNVYDFNAPSSVANTFKYDFERLARTRIVRIVGNYTISTIPPATSGTSASTRIDVLLRSRFDIPSGTSISFELFEITSVSSAITLANANSSTALPNLTLNGKVLTGTTTAVVSANTFLHFTYTGTNISIATAFNSVTSYSRAFILEL